MSTTTTKAAAFEWNESLDSGNATIRDFFIPWAKKNDYFYQDFSGQVLDRKFGIDGILINPRSGTSATVQVKKDDGIAKYGRIYLEVSKIMPSSNKTVTAIHLYQIDTTTMTMYRLDLRELQANFHILIEDADKKSVKTFDSKTGQSWSKPGYPVPLAKVKQYVTVKEIQL